MNWKQRYSSSYDPNAFKKDAECFSCLKTGPERAIVTIVKDGRETNMRLCQDCARKILN